VDNMTCGTEMARRLGTVARTLNEEQDLFAVLADPLAFACRRGRFPSGPAFVLAEVPEIPENLCDEEFDSERWDGLS
jgi:hypothetical protein